MECRLVNPEELETLAALRWALWLEDGEAPAQQQQAAFVESFIAWLEPKLCLSWFVWCAVDNSEIISTIYVQRIEKLPKPSAERDAFGYVTSVYTKPAFRNQGMGTQLLERVQAWALEADLQFLVLWPSDASAVFWTRAGYTKNESLLREIRPYIN